MKKREGTGTISVMSLLSFLDLSCCDIEPNSEMLGIAEKGNNIFLRKVLTKPSPNSYCTLNTCLYTGMLLSGVYLV